MDGPIGMFDSGFGGLTVARATIDLLPAEDVVYIGDTGRYPYGSKPLDEVRRYSHELAHSLVDDFGAKAIVVACNTATAAGLDDLRAELGVPVIDVIVPGARSLVATTVTGRVGVIGTVGTVASGAYVRAVAAAVEEIARRSVLDPSLSPVTGRGPSDLAGGGGVTLTSAACPGFVEFVERGQTTGDEVSVLAERLLAPIIEAEVDALLLGCTHYPFLARTISDVMGPGVTLVSSADETAFAVMDRLGALGLLRPTVSDTASGHGRHRFVSSGDVEVFRELGGQLLGPELDHTEPWEPSHR